MFGVCTFRYPNYLHSSSQLPQALLEWRVKESVYRGRLRVLFQCSELRAESRPKCGSSHVAVRLPSTRYWARRL